MDLKRMSENLQRTIGALPEFIEKRDSLGFYESTMGICWACHWMFPWLVSAPRPLLRTPEGRWIYVVELGSGPLISIYDLLPHGGELFWLNAAGELVMFACDNPWMLDNRKIILLFSSPDEAAKNCRTWGSKGGTGLFEHDDLVFSAIRQHYRHPHPRRNPQYSYPIKVNGKWRFASTPAAKAGMLLVNETYQAHRADSSVKLVSLVGGHNQIAWYATQFHNSGPGAQLAAQAEERAAARLRIALDPGPAENPFMRRHPGTVASWHAPTAAARLAYDPTSEVGGTPLEWARRFFPRVAYVNCEIPMLRPGQSAGWVPLARMPWDDALTVQQANADAEKQLAPMRRYAAHLIDLAFQLPAGAPFVAEVRALAQPGCGWGTRQPRTQPPWTVLTPSEIFATVCAWPLYTARAYSLVTQMVKHNLRLAGEKSSEPEDAVIMASLLSQAIGHTLWEWSRELCRQPIAEAMALQILSAEIAFYAALGVDVS